MKWYREEDVHRRGMVKGRVGELVEGGVDGMDARGRER